MEIMRGALCVHMCVYGIPWCVLAAWNKRRAVYMYSVMIMLICKTA